MRAALATGLVASQPAARTVKAQAGLKVYARMTKDRVSLKKDSKWRSDINIYPVRARVDEARTARSDGRGVRRRVFTRATPSPPLFISAEVQRSRAAGVFFKKIVDHM